MQNQRFEIKAQWEDFQNGAGEGRVVEERARDSGLFWFFAEDNWELLVKVIDACGVNDHFWFFSAATTNVGYTVTVRDLASGLSRTYDNELGVQAPAVTDTEAFPTCYVGASFASCATLPASSSESLSWVIRADADGLPDLLVLSGRGGSATARILSNRGTFHFEETWAAELDGSSANEAAVADFDGDGREDFVVVPTESDDGVVFFENLGDGSFEEHHAGSPVAGPLEPVARDVDRDGRLDLIVPDFDIGYAILLQTEDWSFVERMVNDVCEYLTFGDFDGDGRVDGFCADVRDLAILVDVGGDGEAGPHATLTEGEARRVRVRDLDGDGKDEILLAVFTGSGGGLRGRLDVLAWEEDGLVTRWSSPDFAGFPHGVQVCDLDGDDRDDLAFACGGVQALLASGDRFAFDHELTGKSFVDRFVCEDLDLDGSSDLVSGCRCALEVLCRRGGMMGGLRLRRR